MAAALMKYETIDSSQIDDIMAGREPRPPRDWEDDEPRRPAASRNGLNDDNGDGFEAGQVGHPAGEH